jgi:hypothetical protein
VHEAGERGLVVGVSDQPDHEPGQPFPALLRGAVGDAVDNRVISNDLAGAWDWIGGVLLMIGFAVIFLVKMTYTWLADKNSKYPFTDAEMKRWNVDARIARVLLRRLDRPMRVAGGSQSEVGRIREALRSGGIAFGPAEARRHVVEIARRSGVPGPIAG